MTSTSRVLRAPARSAALGAGLLAAVLLASACQSRVGTAADVSGNRISTSDFDTAYNAASSSQGQTANAQLQREVLAELIQDKQVMVLQKRLGVTTPQGTIDNEVSTVQQEFAASGQTVPDNIVKIVARVEAIQNTLGGYYFQHGQPADAALLAGFPVKDAATAAAVQKKIAQDGSNLSALAATYSLAGNTNTALGQVSYTSLPVLKGLKQGQTTSTPVQSGVYVLYVKQQLALKPVTDALSAMRVTVNPRFGTWTQDPSTHQFSVQPAVSSVVSPQPSAGAASAEPSGAPVPAASAAPSAAPPS